MARKRRAATPTTESTSSKRSKTSVDRGQMAFQWKQRDWTPCATYHEAVHLMRHKHANKQVVIKKILKVGENEDGGRGTLHEEVRMLQKLPECNRIVRLLGYSHGIPDAAHGSAFFEYYPLGDVQTWKEKNFDNKNFKPVPEPYIWRFFIQMTQALAFIHNDLDPVPKPHRPCILHRDIKPNNILVVDNGTTYPSFKLHDFGCATVLTPKEREGGTLCGTYEWQPPENPLINTTAADVWALGACVHFLATGRPPIQSVTEFGQKRQKFGVQPSTGAGDYGTLHRYYVARARRVVTRINLTEDEQQLIGITPRITGMGRRVYNAQYSDELNDWMCKTLHMQAGKRATTAALLDIMVPEAEKRLRMSSGIAGLVDLEVVIRE